ncbi:hypothetical protein [Mycobacteroides abscessus]|uniref:Copper resistance protein A-like protein n=1 Tax=Mycobacteroides abscessus subsp. massiliense TaxID=1962118 RepID=A0A1T9U8Z6_9MYCO|nr:hypothetical protein [Mycobacteroides abscessus]EHM18320.1 hypothetical protein MMAS_27790 [Mycobacteroides abscessus subsp. massiliense CCUG 48898 = JCM 15300]EIV64006.1 hypothetical protein MMCCUG48898_2911 [Mycobacteroides abscessus subsp. massiliense CCUG 48898 = JCM 15300]MBE5403959.1 hypothetical protein [Mycobacteroides abscessus]MBE5431353.1 hypothetical protein [Mycobacteroides abscessus]MBE5443844.1 hypothetical protein [Mycobacteroides abscessus]
MNLAADMMHYNWTINGAPFDKAVPPQSSQGQRAVLTSTKTP